MAIRSTAEIAIGVIHGVGAVFNTVYTLGHSEELYREFADRAWVPSARWLTSHLVVPNGVAFTVLLVGFQVAMAIAILTRGDAVGPALVVGGCFAVVVGLFSSPGGTVGNFVLAAIQFALAWTR